MFVLKLFFVHCFGYLSDPVSERDSFSSSTNEDCKVSAGLFHVDALPRRKCTSVNKGLTFRVTMIAHFIVLVII